MEQTVVCESYSVRLTFAILTSFVIFWILWFLW